MDETKHITFEANDPHAWVCLCGNTPASEGFYPCDEAGNVIEPDTRWSGLYVCDRCGRIIQGDSLEVIEPVET